MKLILFHLVLLLGSVSVHAAECSIKSGMQQVALLELYTSEGCSSCPPADQWSGNLEQRGFGTDKVIPIALHVDYWDYIGWKDRFANPAYTSRQHSQASLNRSGFVYTPQVMLNGRDYRGWSNTRTFANDIAAINRNTPRAEIELKTGMENGLLSVNLSARGPAKSAVYLALVEDGLSSDVKAGENNGAKLHHDHVVRDWQGPFGMEGGKLESQQSVVMRPEWKIANARLVAFVQEQSGEVAQAVALPLCAKL